MSQSEKKITIPCFTERKARGQNGTMITLYDYRAKRLSWPENRVRRKDSGSGQLLLLGDGQGGWKAVRDRT